MTERTSLGLNGYTEGKQRRVYTCLNLISHVPPPHPPCLLLLLCACPPPLCTHLEIPDPQHPVNAAGHHEVIAAVDADADDRAVMGRQYTPGTCGTQEALRASTGSSAIVF